MVTQPLGLTGFALFLVFGYLARVKSNDERRWLSPVAVAVAALALTGGLVLAYLQTPKPTSLPQTIATPAQTVAAPSQQPTNQVVTQSTTGPGSPAVEGVHGDVTITVDQSVGQAKPKKPAPKQPDQSSK